MIGACADDASSGAITDAEVADNLRAFDAGVGRCEARDDAPRDRAPEQLGFSTGPGSSSAVVEGSEPASVLEVAADKLKLLRGDASTVDFLWRGPSLVEHFAVGDSVQLGRPRFWSAVVGERVQVMTSRGFSNTSLGRGSRMIPGGPSYELEPECADLSAGPCHPLDIVVMTVFAMRATL